MQATTTIIITHEEDMERGIISSVDSCLETLDGVIEWEIT